MPGTFFAAIVTDAYLKHAHCYLGCPIICKISSEIVGVCNGVDPLDNDYIVAVIVIRSDLFLES